MTTETSTRRVRADELRRFAVEVLVKLGMTSEDAEITADAQVWSDLRGAWRHGVTGRLPALVGRIRAGSVNLRPSWRMLQDGPSFSLLDAEGGWGQVAGTRAMRTAVMKARETGSAITVVRNSEVAAALGWYPTVAIRERMVGMAITNTYPIMPAWGGAERAIGNQAFAIGAPAGRHGYMLFDAATAAMSNAGIETLKEHGQRLPPGVALDAHGRPTLDPDEALAGMVLPMGGYRGYGLALMWEVLTGVLSGGPAPTPAAGKPFGASLFFLAIDPSRSMPFERFAERVDALIDRMRGSPPVDPAEPVRVPAERGHAIEAENRRDGVPVPADRDAKLRAIGAELGVAW